MKTLMMLVGPSYCGKSHFAEQLKNIMPDRVRIFSSDEIRKELYGDASCQKNPSAVFELLHARIKQCLKEEDDVLAIYDATNLSARRRMSFLNTIKTIACYRTCVIFPVPLSTLVERQPLRYRKVSEEIILKQIKNFRCPQKFEGWDDIVFEFQRGDYSNQTLIERMKEFDQKNSHHSLSLYEHCVKTAKLTSVYSGSRINTSDQNEYLNLSNIVVAAFYHDIGKLITQEFDENGEAHYRNHHNASAYMFLCLDTTKKLVKNKNLSQQDLLDITFLIQNHMEFYFRNKKGIETLRKAVSENLFNGLEMLHLADLSAH